MQQDFTFVNRVPLLSIIFSFPIMDTNSGFRSIKGVQKGLWDCECNFMLSSFKTFWFHYEIFGIKTYKC